MPYKDPEKRREATRRWRAANPEKSREKDREWRAANLEKIREADRKWRAANPEKRREVDRKRWRKAAFMKQGGSADDAAAWTEILERGPGADIDLEAAERLVQHLISRGMSKADALAEVFSERPASEPSHASGADGEPAAAGSRKRCGSR